MAEEYLTDDEQLEAVKRAFSEYAPWILGGVVLGVGGWFGIQYYRSHQNALAHAGSGAVHADDRRAASERSKEIPGRSPMDSSRTIPSSPYADQAQLTIARIDVDGGKPADAIAPVDPSHEQLQGRGAEANRSAAARTGFDRSRQAGRCHQDFGRGHARQALPAATTRCMAMRCMPRKTFAGAVAEYNAALGASDGGADAALLQLKLADLASNEKAKP